MALSITATMRTNRKINRIFSNKKLFLNWGKRVFSPTLENFVTLYLTLAVGRGNKQTK